MPLKKWKISLVHFCKSDLCYEQIETNKWISEKKKTEKENLSAIVIKLNRLRAIEIWKQRRHTHTRERSHIHIKFCCCRLVSSAWFSGKTHGINRWTSFASFDSNDLMTLSTITLSIFVFKRARMCSCMRINKWIRIWFICVRPLAFDVKFNYYTDVNLFEEKKKYSRSCFFGADVVCVVVVVFL